MLFSNTILQLPLQQVLHPVAINNEVKLFVLRTDLTDYEISGNKWFKLKYNLENAISQGYDTILTFGGAYSNHIHATAAATSHYNLKSIAVIRGEEPENLSSTLRYAKCKGTQLHFISRELYRQKTDTEFLKSLEEKFGKIYIIPEGGSNSFALKGTSEIPAFINIEYDYLCCAVGTGGTLAGISDKLRNENIEVLGFPALKNGDFLLNDIADLLENYNGSDLPQNLRLNTDYHFGGYAKTKPELIEFIRNFEADFNIPLEQVYTGKMMFGIIDLVSKKRFKKGSTIIAIHTGGLQGKNV